MTETPKHQKSIRPVTVRRLNDEEKQAVEERRIEINYLRHLKKKYPDDDRRISEELNR